MLQGFFSHFCFLTIMRFTTGGIAYRELGLPISIFNQENVPQAYQVKSIFSFEVFSCQMSVGCV